MANVPGYSRQPGYAQQPVVVGNSYTDSKGTKLKVPFDTLNSIVEASGAYQVGYNGTGVTSGINIGQALDSLAINIQVVGDKTYYLSPTGSDDNDGLTSASPIKTIDKLITFPEFITNAYFGSCYVYMASGTYSGLNVTGLNGNATYTFSCPTSSVTVSSIDVRACHTDILFTNVIISTTGTGLYSSGCMAIRMSSPQFIGSSVTGTKYGIQSWYSNIKVFAGIFNSCVRCYDGEDLNQAFMQSCTGTGNTYNWYVQAGTILGSNGTVPTATTSSFAGSGSTILL